MDDWKPTNELRWTERYEEHSGNRPHILQQKWVRDPGVNEYGDNEYEEWRDIPLTVE